MALNPGTIVGGYRIERVLGSGGMGTVYLAKHPSLPRMDALKVLSAELCRDREFRARFEREANVVAGLDHPNIVSVHNRGEEDEQLWIAMQYVEGIDASDELKRDPRSMSPQRALGIITQIGRGLDHAHRKGLLHRDIKPANFLLSSTEGEEERALLADFGVAKSTEDTTELTQTGSFVATIAYASPEQLAGLTLDHRSDIYSLACSFFKLITGQNPYPATQPALVMMGHLHEPPPRVTAMLPQLPAAIDQVLARAMAKNPAERYNSCREFTDAAAQALTSGYFPTGTSPDHALPAGPAGAITESFTATGHGPSTTSTGPGTGPFTATGGFPDDFAAMARTQGHTTAGSAPITKSRKGLYLGAGAATVAATLAAGIGIFALSGNDSPGNTTGATSSAAGAGPPSTQAPEDNRAFEGKIVTLVDFSQQTGPNTYLVYPSGSSQARYLESLGFTYNLGYSPTGDDTAPRAADGYTALQVPDNSYVIAMRSDEKAGSGGILGLPSGITRPRATVLAFDDAAGVAAMRNWSASSEQTLLNKLIPVLRSRIK